MKILGIDYPCIDMGIICGSIPEDGGLSMVEDMSLMGGGKIPNALVAAARLGADAGIIGTIGSDRYGRQCRGDLEFNGVHTERLESRSGTTAVCFCITDTVTRGKRCIESPATYPRLHPQELDAQALAQADVLLLYEMDDVAVAAAEIVRRAGGKVLVDGDEFDFRTQNNLDKIDIFIISEYYYHALFDSEAYEENLRKLQTMGPEVVIVTLGGHGCAGVGPDGYFRLPACSGGRVIDTTGAGDVFHGAYAYYYASGLSAKDSAYHASAVSYIKCNYLGGRTGIPTAAGVEHFLRTGTIRAEDFDKRMDFYRRAVFC